MNPLVTARQLALRLGPKRPSIAILVYNALAGCSIPLHTRGDLLRLLRECANAAGYRHWSAFRRKHGAAELLRKIRDYRYVRLPTDLRIVPDRKKFPAHSWNHPDISRDTIARVVDHRTLVELISPVDKSRLSAEPNYVSFPGDLDNPTVVRDWVAEMDGVEVSEQYFDLSDIKPLSQGMAWFTTIDECNNALSTMTDGRSKSQIMRDALGLIHLPPLKDPKSTAVEETWLFLLTFSGSAAQAAGHFRPSVFEALQHVRFMAKNMNALTVTQDWGHAVDLYKLEEKLSTIDGARERVACQIMSKDLLGGHIKYELLGYLADRRGSYAKSPRPDCDFAARLLI